MEGLYLKSQKLSHQDICQICRISKTRLIVYLRKYEQGGIERLKKLDYKGQVSELNQHSTTREEQFQKNPPRTANPPKIEQQEQFRQETLEPLLY